MKKRIFIRFIFAIILLAGTAAAQNTQVIEPCALLTRSDAERILGGKVKLSGRGAEGFEKWCAYKAVGKRGEIQLLMEILPNPQEAAGSDSWMREYMAVYGPVTPVDNVGETAWLYRTDKRRIDLHVRKNNVNFEIHLFTDKPSTAAIKPLARRIAAKL